MSDQKTTDVRTMDILDRLRGAAAALQGRSSLTAEVFTIAADEIERLRTGLTEVLTFLQNPEWGSIRYMEGSEVYDEKDQAIRDVEFALGRKDDAK